MPPRLWLQGLALAIGAGVVLMVVTWAIGIIFLFGFSRLLELLAR